MESAVEVWKTFEVKVSSLKSKFGRLKFEIDLVWSGILTLFFGSLVFKLTTEDSVWSSNCEVRN